MLSCISNKNCLLCSFNDLFLNGVIEFGGTFLGSILSYLYIHLLLDI